MGSNRRADVAEDAVVLQSTGDLLCQKARKGRAVLRWSRARTVARRSVGEARIETRMVGRDAHKWIGGRGRAAVSGCRLHTPQNDRAEARCVVDIVPEITPRRIGEGSVAMCSGVRNAQWGMHVVEVSILWKEERGRRSWETQKRRPRAGLGGNDDPALNPHA